MLILTFNSITGFRLLGSSIRKFSLLTLCFASFAFAACGGTKDEEKAEVTEQSKESEVVVEEASSNQIVAEVQANKDKWLAHGIKQYQIEMQKICFCAPDAVRMMIFQVAEDEIQDVRYADSGNEVDPSHYDQSNTIEGMFALVEQALEKNPANISISYDNKYGYIKELSVDYQENIADDEITFIASNMKPSG